MSFLKKKGVLQYVPAVTEPKWVPGYWYTYDEYVHKYVSGGGGGNASGPKTEDRNLNFDHGLGGSDSSGLIVDY